MKKNTKNIKKKLKIFNPKLKEECGVFGISNNNDAYTLDDLGLHAPLHRGQEGCGIVSFYGKNYHYEIKIWFSW
jgi:Glutamine phosphoribosylpyrophosphate amidotransferase